VNIVGKINFIVFDKTGTLTEDHLDIKGYRPMNLRQEKITITTNSFSMIFKNTSTIMLKNLSNITKKNIPRKSLTKTKI
jgi:magnesium-transporting ATPase (P-type)